MEILSLSPGEFKSFLLILLRVSIVMFMFPVFGTSMLPKLAKAGLTLTISIILFAVVRPDPALFPDTLIGCLRLILCEVMFGLVISLTVRLFFTAVQLGGQLVGFQMGFAIANILDPESGVQGSILSQAGYLLAVVIFLLLDGHHLFLRALADSFSVVRVGEFGFSDGLFHQMLKISGDIFVLAVKLAAPAIASLLLTSAAFGIIAKVVPQINILIVAFPLQIVVGLFFFGFSLEILLHLTKLYVGGFGHMLAILMRLMGA
ncbi:MAG: flagellar biosynthetic protein FliR [Deltaproteobacteria bacterium]|nr:flagellar biosynthetic protein FliR [Deltaproteobacteria bacterium]RLB96597.1 MAG: flagellar biosynthetic protein FliR [Deltaproteobacteria bacterium]